MHTVHDVGVWEGEAWSQDLKWRRPLFEWMVQELLGLINVYKPFREEADKFIQIPNKARGYTIRSFISQANEKVYQKQFKDDIVNFVW